MFSLTKIICLSFFSFSYGIAAIAQDTLSLLPKTKRTDLLLSIYKNDTLVFYKPRFFNSMGHVPHNIYKITLSPFKKNNWIGFSVVALSSALLIATDEDLLHFVRSTSDKISLHPETNYKILFKVGDTKILKMPKNINSALYQIGEGGSSLLCAGGLWVYGKINKDLRALNTANDLAETFVTMGLTTQVIKRLTGRESPFVATTAGGQWRPFPAISTYQNHTPSYDAFPSGHLATLMATVTVISSNYPEKKWIKPVGYTIMGLSAWAMMNTEVHWAGDYPLAIAIGYVAGKITTLRHKKVKQIVSVY